MNIDQIKRRNEEVGFFFSPETMRFFKSRIHSEVYEGPGGAYFVTSERPPMAARHYWVRRHYPWGECESAHADGEGTFSTRREAHAHARELAEDASWTTRLLEHPEWSPRPSNAPVLERAVIGAFMRREDRSISNTYSDSGDLYLHGNLIARWRAGGVWVSTCGWGDSLVTRSRVSSLPHVQAWQARGELHAELCGREIPAHWLDRRGRGVWASARDIVEHLDRGE